MKWAKNNTNQEKQKGPKLRAWSKKAKWVKGVQDPSRSTKEDWVGRPSRQDTRVISTRSTL